MRLSLRHKLVLFAVLISALPLAVSGQSLIRIARDEMKSAANEQLLSAAREVRLEIEGRYARSWLSILGLLRVAVDGETLGVREKIALLTDGIASLGDIVALQITLEGSPLPIVVSRDAYAGRLQRARTEPLSVLRTPTEALVAAWDEDTPRVLSVDQVAATGDWLATVTLPLENRIGGARAMLSARLDLSGLSEFVAGHPFAATGAIHIVDGDGRTVLEPEPRDLSGLPIVRSASALVGAQTQVTSLEAYAAPDGEQMLGAFSLVGAFDWVVLTERPQADAYLAVGVMIRSLAMWIGVGLVAAALAAVVFALGISRPILAIGEAAIEVARGNLRARVENVRSRDEIGELAGRINAMIVQLNERFQLTKFVSSGTMAAIQRSDHDGVRLGGERREVAILFADIRGYTAFAESRDPELVVEVLNRYFERLTEVVTRLGGDIDKFVGDQIMAVFTGPAMAVDAARSALAIQAVMRELGAENPDWGLDIGIGVAMGEVVMGAMGSRSRMDFTVLGDNVNLAARLCSNARPRQTLVPEPVAAALLGRDEFAVRPLEPISVKGKSAPIAVFDLAAPAGDAAQAAGAGVSGDAR